MSPAGPLPTVAFIGHSAAMSGAEIAMLRGMRALRGHIRGVFILAEDGPLVAALQDDGVNVIVLPMRSGMRTVRRAELTGPIPLLRNAFGMLSYTWRLRVLLRRTGADIIHTYTMKSVIYGGLAGRLAGRPVVWHLHNRISGEWLPGPAVRLMRLLARVLPTAIVSVSQSTAESIPRESAVIYNCLDPASTPEAARGVDGSRPFRYGVLGRLTRWKGQDVFLRAFAEAFPDGDENARFVGAALFDEHDYEAELVALTSELGLENRIEFRGFRSDVWDELSQLDALVHCSVIAEPFGQVVVEGMVAGLPVIATREGGPGEIITDGVDGLLVDNSDVGGLASALVRLRGDATLRDHLIAGARGSAARFGPESFRDDMLAVYRGLLSRPWLRKPARRP